MYLVHVFPYSQRKSTAAHVRKQPTFMASFSSLQSNSVGVIIRASTAFSKSPLSSLFRSSMRSYDTKQRSKTNTRQGNSMRVPSPTTNILFSTALNSKKATKTGNSGWGTFFSYVFHCLVMQVFRLSILPLSKLSLFQACFTSLSQILTPPTQRQTPHEHSFAKADPDWY